MKFSSCYFLFIGLDATPDSKCSEAELTSTVISTGKCS